MNALFLIARNEGMHNDRGGVTCKGGKKKMMNSQKILG